MSRAFSLVLLLLATEHCEADERQSLEMIRDAYLREQQIYEKKADIHKNALAQLHAKIDFQAPVKEMQKLAFENLKSLPEGIKKSLKSDVFESAKTAIEMALNYIKGVEAQHELNAMIIDESTIRSKIMKTEANIQQANKNAEIAGRVAQEAQDALDKIPAMANTPQQFEWVKTSLGKVAEAQQRKTDREAAAAAASAGRRRSPEAGGGIEGRPGGARGGNVEGGGGGGGDGGGDGGNDGGKGGPSDDGLDIRIRRL